MAGSVTATTNGQMLEVQQALGARFATVEPGAVDPGPLAGRLTGLVERAPPGGVVGVRTSRSPADVLELPADQAARVPRALGAAVRRALESVAVAGLYLTGGDVTVGVLEALDDPPWGRVSADAGRPPARRTWATPSCSGS